MKEQERAEVFARLNKICRLLKDEANVLCEFINFMDDKEAISKKLSAIEDEADVVMHDVFYYYQNASLLRDSEAILIFELILSVETCTDAIDDIGEAIVRFNVSEMNDSMATAILSSKEAADKVMELVNLVNRIQVNKLPSKQIIELDRFKIDYKKLYDNTVRDLFTNENDSIKVVRMLKVYDAFMDLFKAYEGVSEKCGKYTIL